jgi:hypothetical protein
MASNKTKRQREAPVEDQREQVLAMFADYVEEDDVDGLFDFMHVEMPN